MRAYCVAAALALSASACSARAQVTLEQAYKDHFFNCTISGLRGAYTWCGADKIFKYAYVFTGIIESVDAVKADGNSEFRLRVRPEEVFLGQPPASVTLETVQGECIDGDSPIHAGDRWLFFVHHAEKGPSLLVYYYGGSAPIAEAGRELALLRLQKQHPDAGLVTGIVSLAGEEDGERNDASASGQRLSLVRHDDHTPVSVAAGDDGRFQFAPLIPGKYEFSANTRAGWWADDVRVDVEPGGCVQIPVELSRDGVISGRVLDAAGRPVKDADVSVDPGVGILGAGSVMTKADGSYELHGIPAGAYKVRVQQFGLDPPPDVFYPGVQDEQLAIPVTLTDLQHRTGVDFRLP